MRCRSQVTRIPLVELEEAWAPDAEVVASTTELVRAAAEGDEGSWELLVKRYSGRIWRVVRTYPLSDCDGADVVAITWLRLVQHLTRIRDPEATGAWLATTAKRECLRALRRNGQEYPTGDFDQLEWSYGLEGEAEAQIIEVERDLALLQLVETLPERCQLLLRAMLIDPPLSYKEISAALGIPIGSIGPTRARCLLCVRRRIKRSDYST